MARETGIDTVNRAQQAHLDYPDWGFFFRAFFLSCKANARVKGKALP